MYGFNFFASLKNLKKQGFNIFQDWRRSKNMNSIFCKLKIATKRLIVFLSLNKLKKHEFNVLLTKEAQKHAYKFLKD